MVSKLGRGTESLQLLRELRCVLFADVSGFSKLVGEVQMRLFCEHVIRPLGFRISESHEHIIDFNTWGDGLFIVFDTPISACRFGLQLRDHFRTDFRSLGLSVDVNIRCAIHAGELCVIKGAMANGEPYVLGDEITLAARIEPIVRPGEVWVTQAVSSNRGVQECQDFVLDDLGEVSLAKGYGDIHLFGLRRPQDLPITKGPNQNATKELSSSLVFAKLSTMYSDLIQRIDSPDLQKSLAEFYSTALELHTG